MTGALRLQGVTLPVPDLEEAERFYRWSFRLEPGGEPVSADVRLLGWGGGEDRVRLVETGGSRRAEEALTLRMPAMSCAEAVRWCMDRGLEPVELTVSPSESESAHELLPEVPLQTFQEPQAQNLSQITVRGWAGQRVELVFPLPGEVLARRKQLERFWWRSGDWSGLETPGLLGVTLAGPDRAAGLRFCEGLGITPLDADEAGAGPLRVGDHQLILEEAASAAITSLAFLLSQAKLGEVARTLKHLGAEFRELGNRVIARDPAGRIVLAQGVRTG